MFLRYRVQNISKKIIFEKSSFDRDGNAAGRYTMTKTSAREEAVLHTNIQKLELEGLSQISTETVS